MTEISAPAKNPCGSCPYRKDVPSGIWARSEYQKLPLYDKPTGEQPPALFLCHQKTGALCAGWVAVHDMEESLGLRFAIRLGLFRGSVETLYDYTTDVPLFSSGREAAAHGLRGIRRPGAKAVEMMETLKRKRGASR